MRNIITIIISLFIVFPIMSQVAVRHNAIKSNSYGVVYNLPITKLNFNLHITETIYKRGEYYQYAKQYLNLDDPIVEDKITYTLNNIDVEPIGVPDKNDSHLITFRANSVEPFVYLTKEGFIWTINDNPPVKEDIPQRELSEKTKSNITAQSLLTEEVLLAGSKAKQAELIAKQIFALRLNRADILAGEAENMPPDGQAYKLVMDQINLQEKLLVELFAGSSETRTFVRNVDLIPEQNNILDVVLIRFSEKLGMVNADDLAGEPIYISLINKSPQNPIELTPKELRQLEKKFSQGLIYNIPSKAQLSLSFKNREILNKEVDIVQFGSQDVLTNRMFDNKKQPIKVLFYPELGAIKQITQ